MSTSTPAPIRNTWNLLIALEQVRGLMDINDVARLLGKSTCTVYRMAQQKKIPSMIIGGERRFDPSVLAMHFAKKHPEMVAAARAIQTAASGQAIMAAMELDSTATETRDWWSLAR